MMNQRTKKWLFTAGALVLFGMLVFVVTMCVAGWDFKKLSTEKYETRTYEPDAAFSRIRVQTDTANIAFLPSEDGKCRVVCYERESLRHTVSAEADVLTVRAVDERKWQIGVAFESDRITVYLPDAEYAALTVAEKTGDVEIAAGLRFGDIDISVSTGDVRCRAAVAGSARIASSTGSICVENTAVGALDLSATTGRITVTDVTCTGDVKVGVSTGRTEMQHLSCRNVTSSGSTGSVSLQDVIAAEKLSVIRSTGDIAFSDCDASAVYAKTSTGDIQGNFLTEKCFTATSDTGRVDVPRTTTGGSCELISDTGDIRMTVR